MVLLHVTDEKTEVSKLLSDLHDLKVTEQGFKTHVVLILLHNLNSWDYKGKKKSLYP